MSTPATIKITWLGQRIEKLPKLGDAVAVVAQPIAKVVDKVAGTNLVNCPPCKQRQEALNRLGETLKEKLS